MNPDEYEAVHRAAIMRLASNIRNIYPSLMFEGSFKAGVEFDVDLGKPVFFFNYYEDKGLTDTIKEFFADESLVNFTYEFANETRNAQFIYKITKRDNK